MRASFGLYWGAERPMGRIPNAEIVLVAVAPHADAYPGLYNLAAGAEGIEIRGHESRSKSPTGTSNYRSSGPALGEVYLVKSGHFPILGLYFQDNGVD